MTIIPRRDNEENWKRVNPILIDGEIIKVYIKGSEAKWKIGNGFDAYNDLPFLENSQMLVDLNRDLVIGGVFFKGSIREEEKNKSYKNYAY